MEYTNLPSVSHMPLSEKVYNILMQSIMDGSLAPGSELKEQHIAKQFGVSATPVREAFKRLASDGLIAIVPYRGAVVKALNRQEIEEAYACREVLEQLAVQQAISRITKKDIERLRLLLEEYHTAPNIEQALIVSQRFDDCIYQLAQNQTLTDLLFSLRSVIIRDRKYSTRSQHRRMQIYQEHLAIVDAMAEKDIPAAKYAVSTHIQNGLAYIRKKS